MAPDRPDQPTLTLADLAPGPAVDLRALLRLVWGGKWLILLATLCTVGLTGYYATALATPRHMAVVTLDIAPATRSLPIGGAPASPADPATQIAVILATPSLQRVIDRLDLVRDPAVNRYLVAQHPLSPAVLRGHLRALLQGQAEPAPDAAAVAAKLVANLRGMIRAEQPRDSHILRLSVTTGDPAQARLIANTLADLHLQDQIRRKQADIAASVDWVTAERRRTRAQQAEIAATLTDLAAAAGLDDLGRADLLARQLADTETRLATTTALASRASAAANRARSAVQIAALQQSRDELALALAARTAAQQRHAQLQNAQTASLATLAQLDDHLRQLALQAAHVTADATIVQAATEAVYVGPQKLLLVQIAALVGALAGLCGVLVRHSLRRGFTDAPALQEAVGLPVLAQLPCLPSARPAALLACLTATGGSAATEGFRHLRTALLRGDSGPPAVILSTSAVAGEGKTTQAIGLAQSYAMLGQRVLLIDGDLRQSAFRRYLPLTRSDGLAAVILGHVTLPAAIEPSPIPGVDLLAGGAQDTNSTDLLYHPDLAGVMQAARAIYDVIIIDAPPVLPVPDALVLAGFADRIVFAVRWEHTPAAVLQAATERLGTAERAITGLTLTRVHIRKQAQRGGIGFARYGRGYFQA